MYHSPKIFCSKIFWFVKVGSQPYVQRIHRIRSEAITEFWISRATRLTTAAPGRAYSGKMQVPGR
jgi:hypothetical protein